MSTKAMQYYNDTPPTVKIIGAVGILAGAIYGVYKWNKNKDLKNKLKEAQIQTDIASSTILSIAKEDIKKEVAKSGISAMTYSKGQYKGMADAMEIAFEKVPTDVLSIATTFKNMRTKLDVQLLIGYFAVRTYQPFGFNDIKIYNFYQFLAAQNGYTNNLLKTTINQILANKKIDFKL